eukprot:TRINITY_DN6645_c0_g1_i1.p1 TRINITY_DN6645_c0_g1~~TRINITY_DN6645_c0_g1_i1.p1  ORF type:complete len:1365 (+),score=139.03 TRINITY_DN6645_c0_g1_i1:227-4096(+)
MVLNLAALANTPGLDVFLGQIETICNSTIANRTAEWMRLHAEAASLGPDYSVCNATSACNASGYANLPSYGDDHLTCRQEQSALQRELDSASVCLASSQNMISQLRYARCHGFLTETNVYPPELPSECIEKAVDNDSNEAYAYRVKTYFDGKSANWNSQHATCQAIIDQYQNESNYCSNLTDQLGNKTAECDQKQAVLDAISCELAQVHGSCDGFVQCWNRLNAQWTTRYYEIEEEKRIIPEEIRAMLRVRCLVHAIELPQGDIDEALAVCQQSTFDPNLPPIVYPYPSPSALPPANCTGEAHCIVDRPCTANYVNRWLSGLPSNAPAAASTVECCTRCQYYEACPAGLRNPHYQSIVGFDDKTCCLRASWQVGSWSPALTGDSCPTGCGLPSTTYARTVTCASEYGGVVQDSNCEGNRNATTLQCSTTASCTSCGACGWGYEMQGCDTSAGSVTGSCVQCQRDLGTYFFAAGNCTTQKCVPNCGPGQYLSGCDGSYGNAGTCVACTQTPGTYFTGPGLLVDLSCTTAPCTICGAGQYNSGCSGTNPGSCQSCTGLNSSGIVGFQEYFTGPGSVNNVTSCPKALCDYSRCPFGQYLVGCGAGNPGTCVDCQPACSGFNTAATCPSSCHWDSTSNTCTAHQFVVPGALGRCRYAPCTSNLCPNGYYLSGCGGVSNGTCQPCNAAPAGQWYDSAGQYSASCPSVPCQNCSTGEYRVGCSGSNGGTCVACSLPPAGSYTTSHGGASDNCPYQSCSSLTCPAGKYRFGCGNHSAGSCVSCTGYATGQYFSGSGGLTDSCPKATCNASVCAVGHYLSNCGGHLSPASSGSCVPCTDPPVNYYYIGNGGTANQCQAKRCYDLAACPTGEYRTGCGGPRNRTGQGYCTACTDLQPGHYYSGSGNLSGSCLQSSCDALPNCEAGHQRVNCGSPSDPTNQGNCSTSCPAPPAGYFHYQGCLLQACPSCGAAQNRIGCGRDGVNSSDTGVCVDCPAPPSGQYFDLSVNTGCNAKLCSALDSCGVGQYRSGCGNRSVGSCLQCDHPPVGFLITGSSADGNSTCPIASCDEMGVCQSGQYRHGCGNYLGNATYPQGEGHCETCNPPPTGMYYSGHGNSSGPTSCRTSNCASEARCPIGYYRSGCGTDVNGRYTSIGSCVKCSSPPTGFYFVGDGGLTDTCPTASCALLNTTCGVGFYRVNCGGTDHPTTSGTCVRCSPPAADRYIVGHGYQNDSCPTEQCETECYVGEFRKQCGGENYPTNPGYCTNCTAFLKPGNVWLTDGDLSDSCSQGTTTTTTAVAR